MNIKDNPFGKEYWCGEAGYRPPGYGDFDINLAKEALILMARPASVLDIGCAYGFTVGRLNMLGIPSKGIDISEYAISQSSFKGRLVHAEAWNMPFADKSFDLAFSSGVLEHIPKGKLTQTIKEIVRVCERGIIGVSCLDDETTKDGADDTHEVILTKDQWQDMFPYEFVILSDSAHMWRSNALIELYKRCKGI